MHCLQRATVALNTNQTVTYGYDSRTDEFAETIRKYEMRQLVAVCTTRTRVSDMDEKKMLWVIGDISRRLRDLLDPSCGDDIPNAFRAMFMALEVGELDTLIADIAHSQPQERTT